MPARRGALVLLACLAGAPTLPARAAAPSRPRADAYGDPLPPGAVARMGTVRWWQGEGVSALAFTPDGKALASAGGGRVVLWDARDGRRLRTYKAGRRNIISLHFSAAGTPLALGVDSHRNVFKTVYLWEIPTGRGLGSFEGDGQAIAAALSPDGTVLASGRETVRLWDRATRKERRRWDAPETGIGSLAFSPDGKTLAAGAGHPLMVRLDAREPADVTLRDVATGRVLRRLAGHGLWVHCVAFSPDGKMLASAGFDGGVRLWDVATGKQVRRFGGSAWNIACLAFSPDGKTLALATRTGAIHLRDVATGKDVRRPDGHRGPVCALAFSPDGKTLASGGDASLRLWRAATGSPLRRLEGEHGWGSSIAFSPDGKVVASGTGRGEVCLWDVATGKARARFKGPGQGGGSVAFVGGGRLVAVMGAGTTVQLADPATGKTIRRLEHEGDSIYLCSLAGSPDGRTLATGDGGGAVRLWDAVTGKPLRRLAANADRTNRVFSLAFSPDGKLLAAGVGTQRVRLWEVASGGYVGGIDQPVPDHDTDTVFAVAFSPDGRLLATAGGLDGEVYLWGVATRRQVDRFTGHRGKMCSLAFSPDGRALASGNDDTTVLVWDVTEGARKVARPGAHLSPARLKGLWSDLADPDASRAYRAVWRLAASPRQGVPWLRRHLRPAPRVDARQFARLVAELGSERFAVRERATGALRGCAGSVEADLRRVAESHSSAEVRRRALRLVREVEATRLGPSPEHLRALRSLAALEHTAGPEARQVLKDLAEGSRGAWLTGEARAALRRLDARATAGGASERRP